MSNWYERITTFIGGQASICIAVIIYLKTRSEILAFIISVLFVVVVFYLSGVEDEA